LFSRMIYDTYATVLNFDGDVEVSDIDMLSPLCARSLAVVLKLNGAGIVLLDDCFTTNLL
jgi:hypothetical protein